MDRFSTAPIVNEIEEVYQIIDEITCPVCGNEELDVKQNTIKQDERVYDIMELSCSGHWAESFIFDVTAPHNFINNLFKGG